MLGSPSTQWTKLSNRDIPFPTDVKPLQTYLWGLVLENPWPAHFFQVHFISELTFQLEI